MSTRGPAFYDDDDVFATYLALRARPDSPNDTLEQPILRELAGPLAGRRILDLGCGAAGFGRYAVASGCAAYVGVDGSHNMVTAARRALAGTTGTVVEADLEAWEPPPAAFDLVVSSLVLHYLPNLEAVLARAARALVPGGRLVVSVEHPIVTCTAEGWSAPERETWLVDDYFASGPRDTLWLGARVVRYHRPLEAYVRALQEAGLVLEQLREARPERQRFADEAEFRRRLRVPLFLFLAGRRPDPSPHDAGIHG